MRIIGLVIALLWPSHSWAQDAATLERLTRESLYKMLGTISVEAKPLFNDGRLFGCALEYNAMAQDTAYKQGAFRGALTYTACGRLSDVVLQR